MTHEPDGEMPEPWQLEVRNFDSSRHAYATGATLATLRQAGIDAVPVIDLEANYTPAIELRLAAGTVTIHVEPPDEP
jgi:hypothetical protein